MDANERLIFAWTGVVNQAGDQLLPGPTVAADKDGSIGLGRFAGIIQRQLKSHRLPDDALDRKLF